MKWKHLQVKEAGDLDICAQVLDYGVPGQNIVQESSELRGAIDTLLQDNNFWYLCANTECSVYYWPRIGIKAI